MAKFLAEKAKKLRPQFVVNTGDIVHKGGVQEQWEAFFKIGEEYF